MGYLDKALETMRQQRIRVIDHKLIDRTLQEIGETYRPGLISWIKEDRSRWRRLLDLENEINRATLQGDQVGLTAALFEYQDFFREMVTPYEVSNTFPLFGRRE